MNGNFISAVFVAALALTGCGSLSDVDRDGHAQTPVFPDPARTTFEMGSYPNLDDLRQVRNGVTRDQLYGLLGRPHFAEGFNVREWDYLFHFNAPDGVKTCQFKVLFDADRIARNFHWAPQACADVLKQTAALPSAAPKPLTLSGDIGFAFASAALTPAGVAEIREIAASLKQAGTQKNILVSGHTDRIGNEQSNLRLSEERASAVRSALISNGIAPADIRAEGFGETAPVVQCNQPSRRDLVACLAPNRRVDINARGER